MKYFSFILTVLFAFGAFAIDMLAYEQKLKDLNDKFGLQKDLKSINSYVTEGKKILDQLGIKNELLNTNKEKSLLILSTPEKNKLNKLALSLYNNYEKLQIEINPHVTRKEEALGFYDSEKHKFIIGIISLDTIFLTETTFHHEIRHAAMTYRYLKGEIDNVFDYELVTNETTVSSDGSDDDKTGYEDYLSLQELSTYPIEARQILSIYKNAPKKNKKESLSDLESAISQSLKISKYVIGFAEKFDLLSAKFETYSDKYLQKEYRYLKAISGNLEFSVPYFNSMTAPDEKAIISKCIERAQSLAYSVWYSAEEALTAFDNFKKDQSAENFEQLKIKIEKLSSVSRQYL